MRHLNTYISSSMLSIVLVLALSIQVGFGQDFPKEKTDNLILSFEEWTFVKSTNGEDTTEGTSANCSGFILDFFTTDSTVLLQAIVGSGVPPYSFEWSTGETNTQIEVPLSASEVYCVTITDDDDCEIVACYDGLNVEDCQVDIFQFNSNNGFLLQPGAVGIPPIEYSWSTGDNTLNTIVTQAGVYCLTITDSEDCTAEACIEVTEDWMGDCNYDLTIDYNTDSTSVILDIIDFNEAEFDTYRLNGRNVFLPVVINHQGNYTFTASRTENYCSVSKDIVIDFGRLCDAEPAIIVDTQIGQNILTAELNGGSSDLSYYWTDFFWEESTITATNNTTYCVEIKDNGEGCYYYSCYGNVINDAQLYGSIKDQENNAYSGIVYIYQLRPEGAVLSDSVEATANTIFSTYVSSQYDHILRIQPFPVGDRTFAPSYYRETLDWDEADTIQSTQISLNGVNIFVFEIHDTDGDGLISGGIFSSNNVMDIDLGDNNSRSAGDYLAGHDILLFSIDEGVVVGHQKTNADGRFKFENLALGHYRIMLTRPAMSTISLEVTLTEDSPHNGAADIALNQNEVDVIDDISIFPNPVNHLLNLDLRQIDDNIKRIEIFDTHGRRVFFNAYTTTVESVLSVEIGHLNTGQYVIKLTTDKRQGVFKFFKI